MHLCMVFVTLLSIFSEYWLKLLISSSVLTLNGYCCVADVLILSVLSCWKWGCKCLLLRLNSPKAYMRKQATGPFDLRFRFCYSTDLFSYNWSKIFKINAGTRLCGYRHCLELRRELVSFFRFWRHCYCMEESKNKLKAEEKFLKHIHWRAVHTGLSFALSCSIHSFCESCECHSITGEFLRCIKQSRNLDNINQIRCI